MDKGKTEPGFNTGDEVVLRGRIASVDGETPEVEIRGALDAQRVRIPASELHLAPRGNWGDEGGGGAAAYGGESRR